MVSVVSHSSNDLELTFGGMAGVSSTRLAAADALIKDVVEEQAGRRARRSASPRFGKRGVRH